MTIQFSHSPTAKLYVLTIDVYRMALNATLYLVVFHCLCFSLLSTIDAGYPGHMINETVACPAGWLYPTST